MPPRDVFVELSPDGRIIRIYRTIKAALDLGRWTPLIVRSRADAVGAIREQIRSRADDCCERCGRVLTSATGEMHETIPRGKGGEISLANSEWLCHDCHQGKKDSAHGNRRTRFGEVVNNDSKM